MCFPSALFLIYDFKFLSKPFKNAQEKKISNVVIRVSNHWKAHSFPAMLHRQKKLFLGQCTFLLHLFLGEG